MPSKIILVGSLMLVGSSTCDDCVDDFLKLDTTSTQYTPEDTTAPPPPSDPNAAVLNPSTGLCELDWSRTVNAELGIASVCFDGDYGPDMIADVELEVPCPPYPTSPSNVYEGYENDYGNNEYMVQTTWVPYLCDINYGFGTWTASFPEGPSSVCEDYTLGGVSYVTYDEYGLLTPEPDWGGGPVCPYEIQYGGYYMSPEYDDVPSGPTDCTPGTAKFKLASRAVAEGAGDLVSVWLTPLAIEEAHFPERAWLRRVKVLDWGTASNLHVAGLGDHLSFSGSTVGNGRVLTAAAGNIHDFAIGESPMSAMFGIGNLTLDENTALPEVELSWSCQVNAQSPHFEAITQSPFVAELPAIAGFEHDIVFWVDWPKKLLRIAPEGRFSDFVRVHLYQVDANTASFAGTLPTYDLAFKGKLHKVNGIVHLEDARVAIGTTEYDLDDRVLAPL
jgi:hypothetical protein